MTGAPARARPGSLPKMTAAQCLTGGAERMRRWRRRRAKGLHVIPIQIFNHEIANLVTRGFLAASDRDDRQAISHAMGKMLNALRLDHWPMAPWR
jgi:hypothetical protein